MKLKKDKCIGLKKSKLWRRQKDYFTIKKFLISKFSKTKKLAQVSLKIIYHHRYKQTKISNMWDKSFNETSMYIGL
jgi:hypothetical protein